MIALLAILGGLGLGVFSSLEGRYGHEQAVAGMRALLRRARAAALETREPATVTFRWIADSPAPAGKVVGTAPRSEPGAPSPGPGAASPKLGPRSGTWRVEAISWAALGLWRFEDDTTAPDSSLENGLRTVGSPNLEGSGPFVEREPRGIIGAGLIFEPPGAHLDFGDKPRFHAPRGVALEAWIAPVDFAVLRGPLPPGAKPRPDPPARRLPRGERPKDALYLFQVAGKGDAYYLQVREDLAVEAGVVGTVGTRSDVRLLRETPPGVLVPQKWAHVAMRFEAKRDLAIEVNGLRREVVEDEEERRRKGKREQDPIPESIAAAQEPFVASHPDPALSFVGAVDEVKLKGIVAEETIERPTGLEVEAPETIRFDADGHLDPLHHEEPVVIVVKVPGKAGVEPVRIVVEMSGMIR